ncbi:MAG: hypothetical protein GX963_03180, partial [Bacteroidales bacterium]|nr:hypothetical protein [Bacteroidales bacterium]
NKGEYIEYIYNYNQLVETIYPENPNMNIRYKYGEPTDGNNAGRLTFQEDATGLQQFEYGKLGELTKNIRTFALDPNNIYTFVTKWQYDTWNRLKEMIYPDGEVLTYSYDKAGMLKSVSGIKGQDEFDYILDNAYNKFGSKVMTICGNGIKTDYNYDILNRLQRLTSLTPNADTIQSILYTFDPNNNIIEVQKSAQQGVGGAMHSTTIKYDYDQASRLTYSSGSMNYSNNGYGFEIEMQYSPSGNITDKQLDANILEVSGATHKQYDNHYQYNQNQPHTINTINNGQYNFLWSVNGNMTYSADPNGERGLFWDEENRLTTVVDMGKTANYYTYDATGERTLKLTGNFEQMNINGQYNIDLYNINRFALHTSPYIVFNNHGYTKHYYVEADRIASKIGGGMSHSGNDFGEHIYEFDISTQNDYGRKSEENAKTMYNHLDSAQSSVGSQFDVLLDVDYRIIRKFTETDEPENKIFFFHKDHLGSSTQISDMGQRVIHHIEYMPSGELFAEQRDYWHTPFKFNGKELDEETGYYYYGARYYTPEVGVWLSVDPLADKYPSLSPFMYCAGNPVVLVDPDGRAFWEASNVREARKYQKNNGGTFEKWKGTNKGGTYASVNWNSSDGTANSKVFEPTNDSWGDKITKFSNKLLEKFTGGLMGTADNGQGQETRKGGDAARPTDLKDMTSNIPEPFMDGKIEEIGGININKNGDFKKNEDEYKTKDGYFSVSFKTPIKNAIAEDVPYWGPEDSARKIEKIKNDDNRILNRIVSIEK